jgi:hypothetical protein
VCVVPRNLDTPYHRMTKDGGTPLDLAIPLPSPSGATRPKPLPKAPLNFPQPE